MGPFIRLVLPQPDLLRFVAAGLAKDDWTVWNSLKKLTRVIGWGEIIIIIMEKVIMGE